jgi:hypothetical protein
MVQGVDGILEDIGDIVGHRVPEHAFLYNHDLIATSI